MEFTDNDDGKPTVEAADQNDMYDGFVNFEEQEEQQKEQQNSLYDEFIEYDQTRDRRMSLQFDQRLLGGSAWSVEQDGEAGDDFEKMELPDHKEYLNNSMRDGRGSSTAFHVKSKTKRRQTVMD